MTLPLRHLSVRVPWHDNGWNGTVCKDPLNNSSCLFLDRINEKRDDALEKKCAGLPLCELAESQYPACIAERANFMCSTEIKRHVLHPYSMSHDLYKDFQPTPFVIPPYSFAAVPFRWMMKESRSNISLVADEYGISEFDPSLEPDLGFSTRWVQDKHNQEILLHAFFSAIQPEKSLCFVYAKHVPLVDRVDRILIGVGRVQKVGAQIEYRYAQPRTSKRRSVIWETVVHHSIREDGSDGFLLPYQQVLAKAADDPTIDLSSFVAFAPNWEEFSYASEHISHSSAIDALLSLAGALKHIGHFLAIDYALQLRWIDDRMSELWNMRGPYPGLGSVLTAFGIEQGNLVAWEIAKKIDSEYKNPLDVDPWMIVEKMFENPAAVLSIELAKKIGKTLQDTWKRLPSIRKEYLQLLSRMEITNDQATLFFDEANRREHGIELSDKAFIENPYLFFETSRLLPEKSIIDFRTVDKGLLPDNAIMDRFPLSVDCQEI